MRPHHRTTAIVLTLVAVVFAIFFRTLESGFLRWDDDINVFENSRVQGLTAENLRWMFTDFEQAIRYKPLSWLAWALVHEVFGLNPFGFHLANVVLHCANTVLLFFLLRRLLKCGMRNAECEMESPAWLEVCAALGTLLWAVHPLRVEPVAWVTGLPYHLALFFALLATLFYLGAHAPDAPRQPAGGTTGSPSSPSRWPCCRIPSCSVSSPRYWLWITSHCVASAERRPPTRRGPRPSTKPQGQRPALRRPGCVVCSSINFPSSHCLCCSWPARSMAASMSPARGTNR